MSEFHNSLGGYRLLRIIRGGQTCNVHEAIKIGEKERVAVKVLLRSHAKDKKAIEQLRHEARVGLQMDHENVIKIHGFVGDVVTPFIAMQLFNARNLKQELREKTNFLQVNMQGVVQRCGLGLEYLHDKGWLHCDIKPDNYLVDEQGTTKLIDFSIAKAIKPKGLGGLFKKGGRGIQGTRSYMSPEQILGKRLKTTSDVYGFGCLLHELLAGKPPFTGVNPTELLKKHLTASPPSLQALNKRVTEEFMELVQWLLQKEPSNRPQSMSIVCQELDTINVYRPGMRPTLEEAFEEDEF